MTWNQATALAEQAADLLPEAPAEHDSFDYLAWEELVLSTARRLLWAAGGELNAQTHTPRLDALTGRLTGTDLLALAALTADPTSCAGELALGRALAGRPDHAGGREASREPCDHASSRRHARPRLSSRVQPFATQLRG